MRSPVNSSRPNIREHDQPDFTVKQDMTEQTTMTASDLYAQIATAFVSNPALEQDLLTDFHGAVARHFGVSMPKPGTLARTADGFRLTYDGHDYDLGDPRTAAHGELNDAELELVSGGGNCDAGGVELDDKGNVTNPGSEGGNRHKY